jgi:hypothetical protein
MNGDFSRLTFQKKKRYSGVLMQQGRVQVDADWNEQQAIVQYRTETTAQDIIGTTGAPKPQYGGGFQISVAGGALNISPGRIYVQGILCENDQPLALTAQSDLPLKNGNLAGFTLPAQNGIYLAYLDVWRRHLTAIDDPEIREKALGGPDTATRSKVVWQVRLFRAGDLNANLECGQFGAGWKPPEATSNGTLIARPQAINANAGPCVLPPTAGYRRLENQLYRVEVHRGGTRAQARFKWSRDNGSVLTDISQINSATSVNVGNTGRDDVLGFARDQWVEAIDDRMELNAQTGELVQIDTVNPSTGVITFKAATPLPALDQTRRPKLRRWDQSGATATNTGIGMSANFLPLEDGIEVQFSDNTFRAGDYWLIPARTAINTETGSIEWPRDPATGVPQPVLPHGVAHHYCPLALVDFNANAFTVLRSDCRELFPPLTDITASDVTFDNQQCLPEMANAKTVQDALDVLCHAHGSECTLLIEEGAGWQSKFDQIAEGQDAQICFQVGTFELDGPLILSNKGHLKITGGGPGTLIRATNSEAALVFDSCKSVLIRDLSAETRRTGSERDTERDRLNGTLTFLNCGDVNVEHAKLRCGESWRRAATCITVRNDIGRARYARIRKCDLTAGHMQIGILIVNTLRAHVEDNRIQVHKKSRRRSFANLMLEKRYRAKLRRLLIREPVEFEFAAGKQINREELLEDLKSRRAEKRSAGKKGQESLADRVILNSAGLGLHFSTDMMVVAELQRFLQSGIPQEISSRREMLAYVARRIDDLLRDGPLRGSLPSVVEWFNNIKDQNPAVLSKGIVIGGDVARDVRILNNTVQDVLRGIHIGLSNSPRQTSPLRAGTVTIAGNTIEAIISPLALARGGIFSGNCDTLKINNNFVRLRRFSLSRSMIASGITAHGFFGEMMIVSENHLVDCTVGIYINVLNQNSGKQRFQWRVAYNMAPNASNVVKVDGFSPNDVSRVDNFG